MVKQPTNTSSARPSTRSRPANSAAPVTTTKKAPKAKAGPKSKVKAAKASSANPHYDDDVPVSPSKLSASEVALLAALKKKEKAAEDEAQMEKQKGTPV
jgi:hypothetical protein